MDEVNRRAEQYRLLADDVHDHNEQTGLSSPNLAQQIIGRFHFFKAFNSERRSQPSPSAEPVSSAQAPAMQALLQPVYTPFKSR